MIQRALEPTTNRQDWQFQFRLIDSETGTPVALTEDDVLKLRVRDCRYWRESLTAESGDDHVEIIDGIAFQITFPRSEMQGLCQHQYEVGATFERDGEISQILIGTVTVLDGIVNI